MSDSLSSTTSTFIASSYRSPVYHLCRNYAKRFGGPTHPACNQRLPSYLSTVREAESQGLKLCKSCENVLKSDDAWELQLE